MEVGALGARAVDGDLVVADIERVGNGRDLRRHGSVEATCGKRGAGAPEGGAVGKLPVGSRRVESEGNGGRASLLGHIAARVGAERCVANLANQRRVPRGARGLVIGKNGAVGTSLGPISRTKGVGRVEKTFGSLQWRDASSGAGLDDGGVCGAPDRSGDGEGVGQRLTC